MNEEELQSSARDSAFPFRTTSRDAPFYRPADDSPEMKYMQERRQATGRIHADAQSEGRAAEIRASIALRGIPSKAPRDREVSTTMVFVRLLAKSVARSRTRQTLVPIVPDEARTFGMEALFRQVRHLFAASARTMNRSTRILCSITRKRRTDRFSKKASPKPASMCSFIAAGTAYANHGINTIPFFIYYSMFGFQRIGDLIWAAADMRCRGFLVGGTAGRTTLAGEGLQHQDGHSHVLALPVPNLHRVRSGVCLRDRHHYSGWHQADVRRSGIDLLLPDRQTSHCACPKCPQEECSRRRAEEACTVQSDREE